MTTTKIQKTWKATRPGNKPGDYELFCRVVRGIDRERRVTYYTTSGSVRGQCGHHHRTREAAERCLERDRRGCRSQGGYSDRKEIEITDETEVA